MSRQNLKPGDYAVWKGRHNVVVITKVYPSANYYEIKELGMPGRVSLCAYELRPLNLARTRDKARLSAALLVAV